MLKRAVLAQRLFFDHSGFFTACEKSPVLHVRQPAKWATSCNYSHFASPSSDKLLKPHQLIGWVNKLLSTSDESVNVNTITQSPQLASFFGDQETIRKFAETISRTHTSDRPLRLLTLAHHVGCPLKQNAYETVCHQFFLRRDWDSLLIAVTLGQSHTGKTTSRLLNWRTRALLETKHYALLQNVLEEFKQFKQKPNRRTYHLILSGHLQNHDLAGAKKLLRIMEEAEVPVDASTHGVITTHYRPFGADPQVQEQALKNLPNMHNATCVAVVNNLIQLRLDVHDVCGVRSLLSLFEPTTIRAILEALALNNAENADISKISETIIPIKPYLRPSASTFVVFMNFFTARSDFADAIKIFHSMAAADVRTTSSALASLLHVFCSAGHLDKALQVVAGMRDQSKLPPSLFSFAKIDQDLDFAGIPLTVQIFNALLIGVLRGKGLSAFSPVLRLMVTSNVKPNARTLEIVMAHLSKVERTRPKSLLRFVRVLMSPTLHPTLRHMHIIMSSLMRREKRLLHGIGWNALAARFTRPPVNQIYKLRKRLIGITDTFDAIAGMNLPHYKGLATPIELSYSERDLKSDPAGIALRIRHDAVMKGDMESAQDVFNTLLARGMHPNEYHYSALMEGYTRRGDIKSAYDVMKSAERAGIKLNVVMFTILIVGHARNGNPDLAIQLFEQMITAGIKPDIPSIDAVSSAFFAVGAYSVSRKILVMLWSHIQPFPEELRDASLQTLARHFRALHSSTADIVLPKPQQLELHRKVVAVAASWKYGEKRYSSRARRQHNS